MRSFLENRKGQVVRLIFEINAQKQATQYMEGSVIAVGEDSIILKEKTLGEIIINPNRLIAVQVLQG